MNRNGRQTAKIGAALALIVLAEILIDDGNGAVMGGFAFAWITALFLTRRAIWNDGSARRSMVRQHRGPLSSGFRAIGAVVALPLVGGAVFLALATLIGAVRDCWSELGCFHDGASAVSVRSRCGQPCRSTC